MADPGVTLIDGRYASFRTRRTAPWSACGKRMPLRPQQALAEVERRSTMTKTGAPSFKSSKATSARKSARRRFRLGTKFCRGIYLVENRTTRLAARRQSARSDRSLSLLLKERHEQRRFHQDSTQALREAQMTSTTRWRRRGGLFQRELLVELSVPRNYLIHDDLVIFDPKRQHHHSDSSHARRLTKVEGTVTGMADVVLSRELLS